MACRFESGGFYADGNLPAPVKMPKVLLAPKADLAMAFLRMVWKDKNILVKDFDDLGDVLKLKSSPSSAKRLEIGCFTDMDLYREFELWNSATVIISDGARNIFRPRS